MKSKLHFLVPSLADTIFFVLFLKLALLSPENLLLDCDTGYHIKAGEYILNTLTVPKHDIFSWITPPPRWIAFEWLSEVIMALVHRLSGLTGIVIFFACLIAGIFFLLFKIIRKSAGNIVIAVFIALLVITASSIHWLARPHIFSLLLIIIWYYLLDLYEYQEKNYLYILPLLMLLWVNVHGAFIIGFVLVGIYFLGNFTKFIFSREIDRAYYKGKAKLLFITMISSITVSLINPNGYHNLLYPFEVLSSKFLIDHIGEFQSPNFHNLSLLPFEILLLFTIAILALSRNRLNSIELALMLLFVNMALYSVRNIPLFAIIMAPILVRQCDMILKERKGKFKDFLEKRNRNISAIDLSATGFFWLFLPVVIVLSLVMSGHADYQFDKKIKPVAAVEFLKKERIPGNMYNEYEFGDYVIYSAYPDYRVFIDGRSDMYGSEWMKEYYKVKEIRPGWENILEKNNINFIIFNTDSVLSSFLLERNEWWLIYSDKVANIFVKNEPANQGLIEKYGKVKPFAIEDKDDDAL